LIVTQKSNNTAPLSVLLFEGQELKLRLKRVVLTQTVINIPFPARMQREQESETLINSASACCFNVYQAFGSWKTCIIGCTLRHHSYPPCHIEKLPQCETVMI